MPLLLTSGTNGIWECCSSQFNMLLKVHSCGQANMLQGKPSCLSPCSQNDQHVISCRYQKSELNKRPQRSSKRKTKMSSKGSTWIGSDSQSKGVAGAKVLMGFQLHTKAVFDSSWPEDSKKEKTVIYFLSLRWKCSRALLLETGQVNGATERSTVLAFISPPSFDFRHSSVLLQLSLLIRKDSGPASDVKWQWRTLLLGCCWPKALSQPYISPQPSGDSEENLVTRNLPNNALET